MPDQQPTVDEIFALAYEELRSLAAGVGGGGRARTLSATALVHEAWMKLAGRPTPVSVPTPEGDAAAATRDTLHFRRVVARAMRQILVDHARRRRAEKRGGGALLVTYDDTVSATVESGEDVLALQEALQEFERVAPRQAAVVEMRFFGGFEVLEVARHLGVSEATVMRDWRAARAWLNHRLARGGD